MKIKASIELILESADGVVGIKERLARVLANGTAREAIADGMKLDFLPEVCDVRVEALTETSRDSSYE
jgi:hypothetical protein